MMRDVRPGHAELRDQRDYGAFGRPPHHAIE
jgi:hypothetical protein